MVNVRRVIATVVLLGVGIGILSFRIPVIHSRPIALLLDHPLFVILLGGWYLGRPAIGMVAQYRHEQWRSSLPTYVGEQVAEKGSSTLLAEVANSADNPPSLSVIVPAYNEEDQVRETVDHIFSQEYGGQIEIVIIDDGSTDDTWAVLQGLSSEYENVVVDTKENGGIGETQNYALPHCSNEVVVNIDADTHLEDGALREIANVFRDEDTVAVGGNLGVLNPTESVWTRVQTFEYSVAMELARMFQSRLKHLLCVSGGFGAFRTDALKEVGGWNEEDTISDDFELSIRMHEKGRVWFTPSAIALTEVPSTARGWWKQRVRWARNGLRTMILHKDKQFSIGSFSHDSSDEESSRLSSVDLTGIVGLPLKAIFSAALLFKVGQWGVQILTGDLSVGPSLLTAVVAVMAVTTPLALILLGLLTAYANNLRMYDGWNWTYLPLYATVYRPIHITVKVVGFIRAFIIEGMRLLGKLRQNDYEHKSGTVGTDGRGDTFNLSENRDD